MSDNASSNTLGKYTIVREIARSNDIVFEAIDPTLGRKVALKELWLAPNLAGEQKQERIKRFWREGKASGSLEHPNIVTVHEVGKDGDRLFIAMEYLEGQNLRDAMKARGPLPVADLVEYTVQLCKALAYAHSHGVIHRDIKPENIHILPGNHIKLTDFGIARISGESSITQDGQVFGTPSYMSPEQVAGKDVDQRSDIFSTGVIMYEMLTGSKPFTGDGVVTITYNIVNTDPNPPSGAPPYLSNIIMKAMEKNPDERYQSIEELADDLKNAQFTNVPPPDIAQSGYPPMGSPTVGQGSYQSPFGVPNSQNTPYSQTQSGQTGGTTPYGTPVPQYTPQQSSPPDPFARNYPTAPRHKMPVTGKPLLSSYQKSALGVGIVVLTLIALLFIMVWAVTSAYRGFREHNISQKAGAYMDQGMELYEQGEIEKAIGQWAEVIRVARNTKYEVTARENIYTARLAQAINAYRAGDLDSIKIRAEQMMQIDEKRPAGHYFMGYFMQMRGNIEGAKEYYHQAVGDTPGNDEYSKLSRSALANIYLREGYAYESSGQTSRALEAYTQAAEYGDAEILREAQTRIANLD